MNYSYYISQHFKKQLKPYLKKHRHLLDDVIEELSSFDKKVAIHLGADTYKFRLKSSDLTKGKSGAFRMIVLVLEIDKVVTPLTIYFKGDRDTISRLEIMHHARLIEREIGQQR